MNIDIDIDKNRIFLKYYFLLTSHREKNIFKNSYTF